MSTIPIIATVPSEVASNHRYKNYSQTQMQCLIINGFRSLSALLS